MKQEMKAMVEPKQFKQNLPLHIICDASKDSLGSVLHKKSENSWETTHFASQFLTGIEQKYSITELELLAVVWAIENARKNLIVPNLKWYPTTRH